MRLVTFSMGAKERLGVMLDDDQVLDLTGASSGAPELASMQALIESGQPGLELARRFQAQAGSADIHALADIRLLAPIPRPIKIRDCQLMHEHVERGWRNVALDQASKTDDPEATFRELERQGRAGMPQIVRDRIIYYNSDTLSVSGTGTDVEWPRESDWIDYELEWAAIIGRTGKNIEESEARSYIFGYTIFNDFSARDIQIACMPAALGPNPGKDIDNSNVFGPCIVTSDSLDDPYNLTMRALVNGEEWSLGSTGSMGHSFERAISWLTQDRTIYAGEILGSGTVGGGCGLELGRRLNRGDVVECEIEGIGRLRNKVV